MSESCHTHASRAAIEEGLSLHNSQKWYALAVKPRHEKSVHRMLEIKQQETFLPLYERNHRYARREKVFHLPWFPGYVFCRFSLKMCRPVITTPGVIRVLGPGGEPTAIDDSEINSMKLAVKAQTPIEPWPFLQTGERIRITEGALAGMEGTLIQVKHEPRIVLSVSLLQRSVLLEIDREMVARSASYAAPGLSITQPISVSSLVECSAPMALSTGQ